MNGYYLAGPIESFMDGTSTYQIRKVDEPGIIGAVQLRLSPQEAEELGETLTRPYKEE